MSFSFSFTVKREEVAAAVDAANAPDCVKEFVKKSVEFLTSHSVAVNAYGHICDGPQSYSVSNASITVTPVNAEEAPVTA